ncbi:MAG: LamG domain-containing protein, partial [Planctomycetota bacterium]
MSKKLLFLISFVLVLSLAASALAYDTVVWDNQNGAGNRLWNDANNWTVDAGGPAQHKVPEAIDWAVISDQYTDDANGPIINAGTNAVCEWIDMGYGSYPLAVYGDAVLTMTDGNLTASSYITMINADADGNAVFNMSGGHVEILELSGTAFTVGEEGAGIATFNISDGIVDVYGTMRVGWWGTLVGKTVYGIVNMSGGTINTDNDLIIGQWEQAEGTLNMTAGDINVGDWLEIGGYGAGTMTGTGHIDLQGGTIEAYFLSMGGGGVGTMNFAGGTLIIDGDYRGANGWLFDPLNDTPSDDGGYTGTIAILAQRGLITVYDTNVGNIISDGNYPSQVGLRAVLNLDYDVTNPGQTTITGEAVDPNLAWGPDPLNGSGGLAASAVTQISWSAGDNAASHNIYFGTSFAEVNDANTSSGAFQDNQLLSDVNYPVSVIWGRDYYWRIDEVNNPTWKGAVWSFATMPAWATNPNPDDEEGGVSAPLVLTWTAGPETDTHELYFSTDYNDVNERLITPATPGANSYSPGVFEFSTTYYWAVDEVNEAADVNVWYGEVWEFTTTDHLVVDDFESYANTDPDLYAAWHDYGWNDSGAVIALMTDPDFVRDGNNSLAYDYDNDDKTGGQYLGSWIDADIVNLDIDSDWTIGGAKALRLYFAGQPGNSAIAGDTMWVELEDTSSNTGVAKYDGDPNDVKEEPWHEWAIDLGIFDACGVSLTNVDKIHIGFGGVRGKPAGAKNPALGGTGTMYFDTIEVWPPYCRSEAVTADITGDCVTNIYDIEVVADDWLLYDYNFIAAEPCEANLIGWWKLDEGSGTTTADSSIYGNDGNIIGETSWTTGHPNDPCDSALNFGGLVTNDYVVCALRDGNGPGAYPNELMPATFTVSCWAKLDNFEYFSSFVGNGMDESSNECGFFFYNYGWEGDSGQDFGLAIRTEAGMYYVETENIYDTKTWYHLAAIYDGNYASVYVDGLLAAGPTDVGGPMRWISDSSGNYPQNFTIGVWLDPGYSLFVNGIIDEVRYYNLPLSQGDIAVLAGLVTPGASVYQPVPSLANITDPELKLSR